MVVGVVLIGNDCLEREEDREQGGVGFVLL